MRYAYFIFLRALPAWLRLARARRRELVAQHLSPLLADSRELSMRYFDAEAFSASCSDVMLVETPDPRPYYFLMERLRDSPLISEPYFEVVQIVPAVEEGYADYEQATGA